MDRRSFLKTSAVSLAAIGAESASMSVFAKSPASSQDDLSVLFLGTGAADWNGKDSRGEHRRLSSILVDRKVLFDLTPGNLEMIANVLHKTGRYAPLSGEPVYLTHMARTLHGTQAELDASLPGLLRAAYDGLEVLYKTVKK